MNINHLQEANARMFVFLDLEQDSSFNARQELFDKGVRAIKNHWYTGDLAGQTEYGGLGSYIHNYLSLWRQFGLFAFMLFIILILFLIYRIFSILWKVFLNSDVYLTADNTFLILGGL